MDEDKAPAGNQLDEAAEADAYATSLPQAVEICMAAAKGELPSRSVEHSSDSPVVTPFPVPEKRDQKQKLNTGL